MTPSRDSAAGRAYLDLQKQARADGRPVQELFQLYILEAFLDRLSPEPGVRASNDFPSRPWRPCRR